MLATLQQKEISGIMRNLWHFDPVKGKWAVLAKAYTLIRDKKGKANAPLDGFLNLNAPYIGIANPDEYLIKLGWEIALGEDGGAVLRQNPNNDSTDPMADAWSNFSVQDIINHSYKHGYIDAQDGDIVMMPENEVVLSMTTSGNATPPVSDTSQVKDTNTKAGDGNQGLNNAPNDAAQSSDGAPPPPGQAPSGNDATTSGDNMNPAFYHPGALDIMLNGISGANTAGNFGGWNLFPDGNIWGEFIPNSDTQLTFDPFVGDEHDAFNMGDVDDALLSGCDITNWVDINAYAY